MGLKKNPVHEGILMYQKSPLPAGKKGSQNTPNKLLLNLLVISYAQQHFVINGADAVFLNFLLSFVGGRKN